MAGFAHALAHGAVQALTLPADAPCVTPGEVSRLLDAARPAAGPRVVLVPSHDRDGTNAVLLAPPDAFPPSFGPGSFARHLAQAEARGLDCRVVELAGLGLDIDEPRDLAALIALKRGVPAYAFLRDAVRSAARDVIQTEPIMSDDTTRRSRRSVMSEARAPTSPPPCGEGQGGGMAGGQSRPMRLWRGSAPGFPPLTPPRVASKRAFGATGRGIRSAQVGRGSATSTTPTIRTVLRKAEADRRLTDEEALALAHCDDLPRLMAAARRLALAGHGHAVSFSKKVFIPLTRLCRDSCHYCTFARPPRRGEPPYLSPEEVLAIARAGQAAGCKEALFTLGDQPERRYAAARAALADLGAPSTLAYLEASAGLVLRETGLLPHLNPGVMDEAWLQRLRAVSVSQGLMLETTAQRLSERGGPHFGSPDKAPRVRLATLEAAGRARVPFTTGLLIGIGETRAERIETLLAIRAAHERWGHIQEVIVQNFRAKPATRMASAPEPTLEDHLWTIAVARLVLGPKMHIQAPPNLQPEGLVQLIEAGIDDWGGVSPVTPDHVNPEAPWPHLETLERATERAGRTLVERLAVYPEFLKRQTGGRS